MAGTTGLEPAASAVTGQRSNQLNYVPNRGSNNLAEKTANKAFAGFAYSARVAFRVKECGCFRRNRPQTVYKSLCAHCEIHPNTDAARGEAESAESAESRQIETADS
jgi:hypothetical protein